MKFRFIGNPNGSDHGRNCIDAFGYFFPMMEFVEVDNDAVAAKLLGNSHFEAEPSDAAQETPRRRGRPPKVQDAH